MKLGDFNAEKKLNQDCYLRQFRKDRSVMNRFCDRVWQFCKDNQAMRLLEMEETQKPLLQQQQQPERGDAVML